MSDEVAVLGAGNMGTALAQVVASNGYPVRLWSIEHDVLEEVRDKRLNTKYLDGIKLNHGITAVWELGNAIEGAKLAIVSVPSQVVRRMSEDMAAHVQAGQLVLNVAKGLEADTHLRMSEVICEELDPGCAPFVGSMGGPAIAIEMARGLPLAVIISERTSEGCAAVQEILQNAHLKVDATQDVPGLELCATLKNVYAISLGICDGVGYGTNYKAFLASVALGEMQAIVRMLGGENDTVFGLAGLGDLLTTGFSAHSRNRTMGEKLATGNAEEFLRTNTVEGVIAVAEVKDLIAGRGLATPLLETIHAAVHEGRPAAAALRGFFEAFSYGV